MLGRLAGLLILVGTVGGVASCAPPPVIPRCQGFESLTCETRMLCVVVPDGCQECVCERRWTDVAKDPTPPEAEPSEAAGGEGEGEGEGGGDSDAESDAESDTSEEGTGEGEGEQASAE